MDKCFIDALFANTDKKVKGEELDENSIDCCRDYCIPGIWVCFILLHKSWKGIR